MLEWNEQNRAVGDRHEFRVFYGPGSTQSRDLPWILVILVSPRLPRRRKPLSNGKGRHSSDWPARSRRPRTFPMWLANRPPAGRPEESDRAGPTNIQTQGPGVVQPYEVQMTDR
jgi:hypothetical protein